MTLYSQIKQYLDYGLMVVVVTRAGEYLVFHRVTPKNLLETTYSKNKIQDSLCFGSRVWTEEEISEYETENGWKIHSLLPRPITPYPEGMKVRVDESYRKMGIDNPYDTDNAVEKIDRVHVTGNGSYVYELSDYSEIDHRFLIPVLEEEQYWEIQGFGMQGTNKEYWLKVGRKNGWIKGGEVIE